MYSKQLIAVFFSITLLGIIGVFQPALANEDSYENPVMRIPTSITLDKIPSEVFTDQKITFTGKLTAEGRAVGNALVKIIEDDGLIRFNEVLVTGTTDSYGRFSIPWDVSAGFIEKEFEIYAKFDRGSTYKSSQSNVQKISVSKYSGSISLDWFPSIAEAGEQVRFTGTLVLNKGSPEGAKVYIKDNDPWSGDDLLATAYVNRDGSFAVTWYARNTDPDGIVDVYAVFEGNSDLYRQTTCDSGPTLSFGVIGGCKDTRPIRITAPSVSQNYLPSGGEYMELKYALPLDHNLKVTIVPAPDSFDQVRGHIIPVQDGIKLWEQKLTNTYGGNWRIDVSVSSKSSQFFDSRPDIIVNLVTSETQENCNDWGGWARYVPNPTEPIQTYVCSSSNGYKASNDSVKGTAAHEIIHALGLGHTFNKNGDLMCSSDWITKIPTCPGGGRGSNTPSDFNLASVVKLYGTDGFKKPNNQITYNSRLSYGDFLNGDHKNSITSTSTPPTSSYSSSTTSASKLDTWITHFKTPTMIAANGLKTVNAGDKVIFSGVLFEKRTDGYFDPIAGAAIEIVDHNEYKTSQKSFIPSIGRGVTDSNGGFSISWNAVKHTGFVRGDDSMWTPVVHYYGNYKYNPTQNMGNQFWVKESPKVQPVYDSDNDGIPDNVDECDYSAETFNGYNDSDGCPDSKPVVISNPITTTKSYAGIVSLKQNEYILPESGPKPVIITGQVYGSHEGEKLEIVVVQPSGIGKEHYARVDNGVFTTSYYLDKDSRTGEYSVMVHFTEGNRVYWETVKFFVTDPSSPKSETTINRGTGELTSEERGELAVLKLTTVSMDTRNKSITKYENWMNTKSYLNPDANIILQQSKEKLAEAKNVLLIGKQRLEDAQTFENIGENHAALGFYRSAKDYSDSIYEILTDIRNELNKAGELEKTVQKDTSNSQKSFIAEAAEADTLVTQETVKFTKEDMYYKIDAAYQNMDYKGKKIHALDYHESMASYDKKQQAWNEHTLANRELTDAQANYDLGVTAFDKKNYQKANEWFNKIENNLMSINSHLEKIDSFIKKAENYEQEYQNDKPPKPENSDNSYNNEKFCFLFWCW